MVGSGTRLEKAHATCIPVVFSGHGHGYLVRVYSKLGVLVKVTIWRSSIFI